MNFLSPDKLLNIVQHNDNLLDSTFPLAVDTLWKELSLAITSLNLSKECIELYYETMQAFMKETSPLYLGSIISDELLMFTSSHRDIDKLINKQSPLVPSDVLLLFAINKLYEGVQANNNEQLWHCFGEASEAYALAKITEAVSDTLLFHEEFLDQMPEGLVSQWHEMKEHILEYF